MTRNPGSDAAKALAARGVDVRQGEYDDPAAIARAVEGADSAFAVSTSFEVGTAAEIDQGKALINALHAGDVGHIVFRLWAAPTRKPESRISTASTRLKNFSQH